MVVVDVFFGGSRVAWDQIVRDALSLEAVWRGSGFVLDGFSWRGVSHARYVGGCVRIVLGL